MKEYRRICANISLKALEHNLDAIHDCIDRDTKIIAVVKADGYGHGAVPLAEVMEQLCGGNPGGSGRTVQQRNQETDSDPWLYVPGIR